MGAILANTSWLAVILGTVLCMGLGFVWYNPKWPTGKMWAEGVGVAPDADNMPVMGMVMNTVGLFLAAVFVGGVGASTAILAILAYGALNTAGNIFAGKSINVGLIHTGYWLVGMILVLIAHAIF